MSDFSLAIIRNIPETQELRKEYGLGPFLVHQDDSNGTVLWVTDLRTQRSTHLLVPAGIAKVFLRRGDIVYIPDSLVPYVLTGVFTSTLIRVVCSDPSKPEEILEMSSLRKRLR